LAALLMLLVPGQAGLIGCIPWANAPVLSAVDIITGKNILA
jgi:hypothetical protein